MTREEFRKYIRENIVILDGATGTNLMAAGMPVGVCPEEWVMEHPQVILDLQKLMSITARILFMHLHLQETGLSF